jgi:hypothetical protein
VTQPSQVRKLLIRKTQNNVQNTVPIIAVSPCPLAGSEIFWLHANWDRLAPGALIAADKQLAVGDAQTPVIT